MNVVTLTISLPINGSRQDYLHCVSSALTAALQIGDSASAMALGGLLTLVNDAQDGSWFPVVSDHHSRRGY